jgi:hypothetical protein
MNKAVDCDKCMRVLFNELMTFVCSLSAHFANITFLCFGKHVCFESTNIKGAKLHEMLMVQQQVAD